GGAATGGAGMGGAATGGSGTDSTTTSDARPDPATATEYEACIYYVPAQARRRFVTCAQAPAERSRAAPQTRRTVRTLRALRARLLLPHRHGPPPNLPRQVVLGVDPPRSA